MLFQVSAGLSCMKHPAFQDLFLPDGTKLTTMEAVAAAAIALTTVTVGSGEVGWKITEPSPASHILPRDCNQCHCSPNDRV